jgi:hypothetical protein
VTDPVDGLRGLRAHLVAPAAALYASLGFAAHGTRARYS